ncbi:MAG: type IX secretion system membrane protein PorP/SprF [Deltaproteobacteria bacterium]|nr:type IX secretion system membrane protein PorP/SprF [Deltaproteobacteria bacterium]
MKRLLFIIVFGSLSVGILAQQDPKFTQNMLMSPYFNPGAVGSSDKICLIAAFRNQWTGLPSAPTTTTFTAHMPFNLLGRKHGVGVNLMNDQLGFSNDFIFSASYAFRMDVGNGNLGIGVNVGMANPSIEPEWNGADVIDPASDPAIPPGGSGFGLDMGLGIYYNTENMYVGVSASHLYSSVVFRGDERDFEANYNRHYYLMAGYNLQLANPMFEILPSLMLQTDGKSSNLYLNTNVRYNKKFWGGVSYSVRSSMSILVGVDLMNGLGIGYSYDFDLTPMMGYNSGSHEITVRYCFDLSVDKSPQKYKSLRFL